MLAQGAFSRSLSTLRHGSLKRFQCIGPNLMHRAQFHVRPATLSGRLWFKPDGTPRSKVKGLFIATLAGGTLFTMYSMLTLLEEYDNANYLLSCLVHIQRADSEFSAVDLSDSRSTLSYFRELCAAFGDIPQSMVDEFFDDVSRLMGSAREDVHGILREASLRVHEVLVESKGRDPWETASDVVANLDGAIVQLVEMLDDASGEDSGGLKTLRNQRIKEQLMKDPAPRSSDYEVVG